MILPIVSVVLGLALLVWSADRFVDGAVGVARYCGMSTLLIGMVVVGFGTSAPEMVVSAISGAEVPKPTTTMPISRVLMPQ